jgi:hypothetical protein
MPHSIPTVNCHNRFQDVHVWFDLCCCIVIREGECTGKNHMRMHKKTRGMRYKLLLEGDARKDNISIRFSFVREKIALQSRS